MRAITCITSIALTLASKRTHKQTPILFDADFGGPIDDTFALSYALKKQCEGEIDIRLISVVGRNTTSRATILAKFLEESGYSEQVDIGIGISGECGTFFSINCVGPLWPWMDQFTAWSLTDYKGIIYQNGIDRMIEIIEEYSPQNPIYLVTFGALTNLATIIKQRPDLKQNIKLFTMSGSLFEHTKPFGKFAEFNIGDDIPSAQIVFNDRHIDNYFGDVFCSVPWDTGYYFQIQGTQYQRLLSGINNDKLIKNMIEQYHVFYDNGGSYFDKWRTFHPNNASTSMYDLQVVWLALFVANLPGEEFEKNCESVDYLIMEKFNLELGDDGILVDNYRMHDVWFAAHWKDNGLIDIEKEIVDTFLQKKCKRRRRKNHRVRFRSHSNDHSRRGLQSEHEIESQKILMLLGGISAILSGVIILMLWCFCSKINNDCDENPNEVSENKISVIIEPTDGEYK